MKVIQDLDDVWTICSLKKRHSRKHDLQQIGTKLQGLELLKRLTKRSA